MPCKFTSKALTKHDRCACWSSTGSCNTDVQSDLLLAALKACGTLRDLAKGKKLHAHILHTADDTNVYVSTTLIDMYAKCGSISDARNTFEGMVSRTTVAWNALILGYAAQGDAGLGLQLLSRMHTEGSHANALTFVAAFKCCTILAKEEPGKQLAGKLVKVESLARGMAVHQQAAASACTEDLFVSTSLIDMYSSCRSMLDARAVFDSMPEHNVVAWNTLLLGYAEIGEGNLTLDLYDCVPDPSARTFVAALKACASSAKHGDHSRPLLQRGKAVHASAVKSGCHTDIFVANSLVDMYSKCGDLAEAQAVFESIPARTPVSWNALMLGYVENEQGDAALRLFASMDCEPDTMSLVAALKACSAVAGLETGKALHAEACRHGTETRPVVATALVDLYAKSGSMTLAREVFDTVAASRARTVTWTALIAGYSRQGKTHQVFELFRGMHEQGVQPDGITFVSVISACSHAGLVDRGVELFHRMQEERYGIKPGLEHYHCLVDLFGRAGTNGLEDAVRVVKSMPLTPTAVTWTTLLAACSRWRNVAIGNLAFQSLLSIDSRDAVAYMLMGNIYAGLEMWKEQERILRLMRENAVITC